MLAHGQSTAARVPSMALRAQSIVVQGPSTAASRVAGSMVSMPVVGALSMPRASLASVHSIVAKAVGTGPHHAERDPLGSPTSVHGKLQGLAQHVCAGPECFQLRMRRYFQSCEPLARFRDAQNAHYCSLAGSGVLARRLADG